eukprot:tig00001371_g8435.t1
MATPIEPSRLWGFSGSNARFVDNETVVFQCGNVLRFARIGAGPAPESQPGGPYANIHLKGLGITAFAVSPRRGVIAVAEKTLKTPTISVYSLGPEPKLLVTLNEGTELEFADVAFSRDGSRLASIGQFPDYSIVVWDWEKRAQVVRGALPAACKFLSFSGRGDSELCASGPGHIFFWKISRLLDAAQFICTEGKVQSLHLADALYCHAWSPRGLVYCGCQDGALLKFDPATGACLNEADPSALLEAPIASVLVAVGHLVLACEDGTVRWLTADEERACMALALPAPPGMGPPPVAEAHFSPDFRRVLASTATAGLFALDLLRAPPTAPLPASSPAATAEYVAVHAIAEYHAGPVVAVAPLAGGRYCLSAGADGTVRYWGPSTARGGGGAGGELRGEPLWKRAAISSAITAMAVSPGGRYAALGSSAGVVRLLELGGGGGGGPPTEGRQVMRVKAHAAGVTHLAFSADGAVLASAAPDGRAVFYDVAPAGEAAGEEGAPEGAEGGGRVVCYGALPGEPSALAWSPSAVEGRQLYVATADGRLSRLTLPGPGFEPEEDGRMSNAAGRRSTFALPSPALALAAGEERNAVFALCGDKRTRKFVFPELPDIDPEDPPAPGPADGDPAAAAAGEQAAAAAGKARKLEQLETVAEAGGHEKRGGALAVSADGRTLLSAGADGLVLVRDLASAASFGPKAQARAVRAHSVALGGAVAVALSPDGRYAFTAGADGSVLAFDLRPREPPAFAGAAPAPESAPSPLEEGPPVDGEGPDEAGELSFVEEIRTRQEELVEAQHAAARKRRAEAVRALRGRLQEVVRRNETLPDLERMDRREFVVDTAARDALAAQTVEEVGRVREETGLENVARELVASRIREECWDSMEVKGAAIVGFGGTLQVANFPVRRLSERERSALRAARALRRAERAEMLERLREGVDESVALTAEERAKEYLDTVHPSPRASPPTPAWAAAPPRSGPRPAPTAPPRGPSTPPRRPGGRRGLRGRRPRRIERDGAGRAGRARGRLRGGGRAEEGAGEEDAVDAGSAGGGQGSGPDPLSGPQAAVAAAGALEKAGEVGLLYHPLALCVRGRIPLQVALIRNYIADIQAAFNRQFDELRDAKRGELERLQERNARLAAIVAEIGADPGEYLLPVREADDEHPERVLEVRDEEVTAPRFEAPEEKARREEEERRRRRREEEADGEGDMFQRALMAMMDGTLEAKKEEKGKEEVVRPDWMSSPPETWSEEQKKAAAEIEARAKALQEEKEKARKALEAEAKKVKQEAKEACERFDERLQRLLEARLAVEQAIHEQELRIIRLSYATLRQELQHQRAGELSRRLGEVTKQRAAASAALNGFRREVEQQRAVLDELVAQDRAIDKGARREFAEFEPHVAAMLQLFKRRGRRPAPAPVASHAPGDATARSGGAEGLRASLGASSRSMRQLHPSSSTKDSKGLRARTPGDGQSAAGAGAGGGAGRGAASSALDPFAAFDEDERAGGAAAAEPLDEALDCPEGLEAAGWARLVEARNRKIELEAEVRRRSAAFDAMLRKLRALGEEEERLQGEMERLALGAREASEALARAALDVEVLLRLKQGQVEVQSGPVVTDLGDALLLPRAAVADTNSRIKAGGSEKVGVLREMKEFRKGIVALEWENRMLDMKSADWVERTRDLQLLRVTKGLQSVIRGGEEKRQQDEVVSLEKRLEHMRDAQEHEVQRRREEIARVQRQLDEKQDENDFLGGEIGQLAGAVDSRGRIAQVKGSEEEHVRAREQRMREMVAQRRLREMAATQTDEIEMLRAEVARIRKRTFPIFAPLRPKQKQMPGVSLAGPAAPPPAHVASTGSLRSR